MEQKKYDLCENMQYYNTQIAKLEAEKTMQLLFCFSVKLFFEVCVKVVEFCFINKEWEFGYWLVCEGKFLYRVGFINCRILG